MRFLVDRCAGLRLADWLRRQGHDVLEARDQGPDPGDRALLALAAGQGRVLVTIDNDFGELLFKEEQAHAGLVRLPDVPAARRIVMMGEVIAAHSDDLLARAVITVRGGRIRVSRPPGRRSR